MKRSVVALALVLGCVAACVSYSDAAITTDAGTTNDPPGDDDSELDAGEGPKGPSTSDAAISDAALDVGTPTTPNLLANPDFESGCDNVFTFKATATKSTDAHGGSNACLVCSTSSIAGDAWIEFDGPIAKNSSYVGEMWVKAPKTGTPLVSPPEIEDGMDDKNDTTQNGDEDGPIQAIPTLSADTWTKATTLYTVTKSGGTDVWVALLFDQNEKNHCVLIDDASLRLAN